MSKTKNMVSSVALQLISALAGLVMSRLILTSYGSYTNGTISSISSLVSTVSTGFAEAGLGASLVAALYKPFFSEECEKISEIMNGARILYRKSALCFFVCMCAIGVLFPYMSGHPGNPFETFLLCAVISLPTFIDLCFLGRLSSLFFASGSGYIIWGIQSAVVFFTALCQTLLIRKGFSIITVKASGALIYLFKAVVINCFAHKKYPYIKRKTTPDLKALSQRTDALVHQVVGIIVNYTDVLYLMFFLKRQGILLVSVYTVYQLAASNVSAILNSFVNALAPGFGKLYAKKDEKGLKKEYKKSILAYGVILCASYICMGLFILPFVKLFTEGVNDIGYIRPKTAVLFLTAGFLKDMRLVDLALITNAGHFKETKANAIKEAVINLAVSLALVFPLGMEGVLIGTVCSYAYRSVDVIVYASKRIVRFAPSFAIKAYLIFAALFISALFILKQVFTFEYLSFVNSFAYVFCTAVFIYAALFAACLIYIRKS